MSYSIILAHAEADFAQSVQAAFEAEGCTVDIYPTGQPALDATCASLPDLLIFGTVPDLDGLTAVRHLRAAQNTREQRIMWIMPTQSKKAVEQAWQAGADCVFNPSPSSEEVVCITKRLLDYEEHD